MTFEPSLALQTAIRQHLISEPTITDLVPVEHIRAGSTRPGKLPTIIIANASTMMNGRAAGGQFVATVMLDIHVWTEADGIDRARQIGGVLSHALLDWPATDGFALDDFKHQRTVWPRDPDMNYGHGVLFIEAVVRWSI